MAEGKKTLVKGMKLPVPCPLRATMLGVLLTAASSVGASGYPVIDFAKIIQDITEFGTEAGRWTEQGRQWYQEAQNFMKQYNAMLSRVRSMQQIIGLPAGTQLTPVEADFMVKERCGENSFGAGFAGVIGRLTGFKANESLYAQRFEVCERTQRMRNRQYNEVVEFMKKTILEMDRSAKAAASDAEGERTPGEMAEVMLRMKTTNDQISQQYATFESRMASYDAYISMSNAESISITRNALRGRQGLKNAVTTTAIMTAALCGGGKC